jgi:hypothetical protein
LEEASVSERYIFSIFRAEVSVLGSEQVYIGLEGGKAEVVAICHFSPENRDGMFP